MLYDCWRETARSCGSDLALRDLPTGRTWSFQRLAMEAERLPRSPGRVVFPRTNSAEFILAVLGAWRHGQVTCPLEPGQDPPSITGSLPAEIVHIKTTSATTAGPRLVAFTSSQLAADPANICSTMGLRPEWPNVCLISLAHSYGFSNLVLPLLLHGVPLILAGSSLPEALRGAAARFESITVPGVPALWRTWHEANVLSDRIRLAISAGAPLPVPLEKVVYEDRGIKIHNFYGSSECGGIAYDSSDSPRPDGARVGEAMKGVNLAIAEDGCVEVRSDAVGEGYWPEPDEKLGEGVFRTRDIGELQSSLLYLRGRATDQVNVAGRKVSPEVIEAILLRHEAVRECLVLGVPSPDHQRGEIIVACVALRDLAMLDSVKQFAISHLPGWQVPKDWWPVSRVPCNERGKVSRSKLRQDYLARVTRAKARLTDSTDPLP